MPKKEAQFRFYEELNDFLPPKNRKKQFVHRFWGEPSVKDAIESLGVPHTEVDLILVNGESVGFGLHLNDGDQVAVFPVFESLDIASISKLREIPLRNIRFILDVHLGKMARYLRMLGFDALYRNDFTDSEIIAKATDEKRIILTRDKGILKFKEVTHGYWVRSSDPKRQVIEALARFDLYRRIKPFQRCIVCNGVIRKVEKEAVVSSLKEKTKRYYADFFQCRSCDRVYWKGSHFKNMVEQIYSLLENRHSNHASHKSYADYQRIDS